MSIEGRPFICKVCGKEGFITDFGVVESLDMARKARYYCLRGEGELCIDTQGRRDVVVLNEG